MDKLTSQFYIQYTREIAPVHRSATDGIERYFAQAFTPGSTVLDVGCGSGRDLNNLIEAGYNARGIEPCSEFIESDQEVYSNLYGRVTSDSLPDLKTINCRVSDTFFAYVNTLIVCLLLKNIPTTFSQVHLPNPTPL